MNAASVAIMPAVEYNDDGRSCEWNVDDAISLYSFTIAISCHRGRGELGFIMRMSVCLHLEVFIGVYLGTLRMGMANRLRICADDCAILTWSGTGRVVRAV